MSVFDESVKNLENNRYVLMSINSISYWPAWSEQLFEV